MFPTPIQQRGISTRISYRVGVAVLLLLWILPLLAIMVTSVRSTVDINAGNYWGLPTDFALFENYSEVFLRSPMLRYFLNSIIITVPTVIFAIAISVFASYSLAIHKFRGRILLFAMFIAGNFVPFQILMIPVRDLTIQMGVYDTWWGLIIFHIAFQSGFCVFFMRNFIAALPFSLVESARCEGASELRIFYSVILPLVRPALAALAVLIFTFVWNDFFWALSLVQSDAARPITIGLQALRGQWIASWNLIAAGSVISALPPVIMFFFMQKQFIHGLTFGAVKG